MTEEPDSNQPAVRNPTRANTSDLTGMTLGKYRVVEKLGQGGMAQVYKAYQADLNRYVALKILHPHLTSDEGFVERFRHEARAIAALEHPNSVRIYDFDTDGVSFLVMEYLEGENLKTRLSELNQQNKLMDLSEVCRIVAALADALNYAHAHGIVHRDVKPSNVIITADGRPVLTDFGIARMVDATVITGSNSTLGTPAYMSPEQGKGDPGDARSDIYALGVLLFQLCTGHLPFDADTPYAIVLKHLTAPLPPPRSLRPDLPPAIESVILKALTKDPKDRFQTAGEMANALRAAMLGRTLPMTRTLLTSLRGAMHAIADWTRHPVWIWILGWVGVVAFVCLVLFFATRSLRIERYFASLTPTPMVEVAPKTLTLEGAENIADTWLDPDYPDQVWQTVDHAELRGSHRADRILMGFNLADLPLDATIISATLTLDVQAQDNQSWSARISSFRMVTLWKPGTATYNSPWNKPGLQAGVDYDPTPADRATLPVAGAATLNMTQTIAGWQKRGRTGGGIVLMLSDDSDAQCQYWVGLTEQSNPTNRPTLRIIYKENP